MPPATSRYHLFLLSLWPEGEAGEWRFSLENPRTAERTGFRNWDELTHFIQRWMQAPAHNLDEGQPHQAPDAEQQIISGGGLNRANTRISAPSAARGDEAEVDSEV